MTIDVLFIGAGDLARRCHARLSRPVPSTLGLCRSPRRGAAGDLPLVAGDYTQAEGLRELEAMAPRVVVAVFKPVSRDPEGYRVGYRDPAQHLLSGLGQHRPERILFVSSTRVYAERDGAWVDETSPTTSEDAAGALIAEAESLLRRSPCATTVLRCAGLYGGSGAYLQQRVASGALAPAVPVQYSNRIHRDDTAGFMAFLIGQALAGGHLAECYNVVDDLPAPQHEVERWLADRLGVPRERRHERAPAGHAGKRCSNRLLRATGFELHYPDYRAGYGALLGSPSVG